MKRTNLTLLLTFFLTMLLNLNPLTGIIIIFMLGYFLINIIIQIIKIIWKAKNKNLANTLKLFLIFMLAWTLAYITIGILIIVFLIKATNLNLNIQIISTIKIFAIKTIFIVSLIVLITSKIYQTIQNKNNYQKEIKIIFISNYYDKQKFFRQNINENFKKIISFIYVTAKI